MRIVVPYTKVNPDTRDSVPTHTEWCDVSGDDEAYWRLLRDVWADGESFVVIEHDVVCRPDILEGFESCPEPWCAHRYADMCHPECAEAWANMLGCTRFTADVIAAVPDAVTSITNPAFRNWHNVCDGIAGPMPHPDHPGAVWLAEQPGLGNTLRGNGFTHHWHEPNVEQQPLFQVTPP